MRSVLLDSKPSNSCPSFATYRQESFRQPRLSLTIIGHTVCLQQACTSFGAAFASERLLPGLPGSCSILKRIGEDFPFTRILVQSHASSDIKRRQGRGPTDYQLHGAVIEISQRLLAVSMIGRTCMRIYGQNILHCRAFKRPSWTSKHLIQVSRADGNKMLSLSGACMPTLTHL